MKPWLRLNSHTQTWEVNPRDGGELGGKIAINISSNYNVEIDKLYGPLAAHLIRVRLESATTEWVVERQVLEGDNWIEMARWDCQLGFEDLGDEGE